MHEDFKKFDSKYLVYFHDNKNTKQEVAKQFHKEINKIISLEQFQTMFGEQLQLRIDREVSEKLTEINANYVLDGEQQAKIKDFLKDRIFTEVTTFEYYSYDHKVAMQKLRAVQYKFDKTFQTTLKGMSPQTR